MSEMWAYALYVAAISAAVAGYLRSHHRKLARERAVAELEREVNRDLRELGDLKDSLLADRAEELAERTRLIAELRARNIELARFNYTVSHDLKNPLVTIKTYLGLVTKGAVAAGAGHLVRDLERIGAAADKMDALLEDLLELSRVGRVVHRSEEVALGELVGAAARPLADEFAERGVELEVAGDLPAVRGDRERLLQAFQHLLHNAVAYMGDQPSPRIEVAARPEAPEAALSEVVLYVRDNGVGIDPRYHEKVFRLFERLDGRTEGTGIGLALVKRIVEVHGGKTWVESEGVGHGSTFCLTLPVV